MQTAQPRTALLFGTVFRPQTKNPLTMTMKGSRGMSNMQNKQVAGHRPVPEIRDDLDSRKNEEQDDKGNDVTHNKKETKEGNLKKKDRKP